MTPFKQSVSRSETQLSLEFELAIVFGFVHKTLPLLPLCPIPSGKLIITEEGVIISEALKRNNQVLNLFEFIVLKSETQLSLEFEDDDEEDSSIVAS